MRECLTEEDDEVVDHEILFWVHFQRFFLSRLH